MTRYDEQFGKMVKYYRKLARMSQEELANKLGYKHKSSIGKIESGVARVPADRVVDFAKALGITVEELMKNITAERIQMPIFENEEEEDGTHYFTSHSDSDNNRLRNVMRIIINLNDEDLIKAENILNTIFGGSYGNTNLQ